MAAGADRVEEYRIAVDEAVLADLRERLERTRWPVDPGGAPWRYGTPIPYAREVVAHWLERYDWRRWEARFNAFRNVMVAIDGLKVHALVEKGSGADPMPLVMTHGWPGSIAEFLDVIEPLAHPERFGGDPDDAFTVVVPSVPGYGFSAAPPGPLTQREIGAIWRRLMHALGFPRFAAQGGDVGATVSSWMALDFPEDLIAIHLNLARFDVELAPGEERGEDEIAWMAANEKRRENELGYQQIQGTKPLSLSYALTDSPAGLAAWMLEKFHGWTVPGSAEPPPFDIDHLITNVMLHWIPGPGAAMWTYLAHHAGTSRKLAAGQRVTTPTGFLLFPNDIVLPAPDRWIRRGYNMVHRRDGATGGHFAAFENGPLLVDDVRAFFRPYRGAAG